MLPFYSNQKATSVLLLSEISPRNFLPSSLTFVFHANGLECRHGLHLEQLVSKTGQGERVRKTRDVTAVYVTKQVVGQKCACGPRPPCVSGKIHSSPNISAGTLRGAPFLRGSHTKTRSGVTEKTFTHVPSVLRTKTPPRELDQRISSG